MILLLVFITSISFADSPGHWEFAREIVERHEFYPDGEEVTKPANSWQSLFAVTYMDASFKKRKDCVYYRVPGDEPGKLKVKTLSTEKDCNAEILSPGNVEIENVSGLRFNATNSSASVDFQRDSKRESWKVFPVKEWQKPEPKLLMSSADYKSPRMIFLAPSKDAAVSPVWTKDGTLCHDINQDCQEVSPSKCDQCASGWVEIPNGCVNGPKICSDGGCGTKDRPACRRGMVWQRKEADFDCRMDTSFAWCAKGLSITCDGDKAYCR